MYENIGKKIKTLTKVVCVIGMVITVVIAAFFIMTGVAEGNDTLFILGFLYLLLGPFLCYIGGFMAYGYGELIDKVSSIEEFLVPEEEEE